MHVEIRDAQNADIVKIEENSILGREGGENDIAVGDPAVSGQHARIYSQEGRWYLEDLGSSNGTFVKGTKIHGPVELSEGMRFSLCQHVFNVVAIQIGDDQATALFGPEYSDASPTTGQGTAPDASEITEASGDSTNPAAERSPAPKISRAPGKPTRTPGGPKTLERPAPRSSSSRSRTLESEGADEPLIPYLLREVPRAFAFYLAAVPVMLFNPFGTVRKSIADQSFGAFGSKELIAYALPPWLLAAAINSLGGIILAIVHGGFGFATLMTPLIMTAVMIVVAVVMGFIFHPVLRWIVDFLKGTSDADSRTNYFIAFHTAMPLQFLATGLAVVIAIIPVPFVGVVVPLLSLWAGIIALFVIYAWFKHFRVVSWAPVVVLVLMGALGLLTVLGVVGMVRAGASSIGSGATTEIAGSVTGADVNNAGVRAIEEQIDALREAGQLTPEVEAALRRQAASVAAVVEVDVDVGYNDGGFDNGDASEQAVIVPRTASESSDATASGTYMAPAEPVAAVSAPQPPAAAAAAPIPDSPYQKYLAKRNRIEEAIERDPTSLNRSGVLALYRELHTNIAKMKMKYKVKLGKRPTPEQIAEIKINSRLREAETFKLTAQTINKLHAKLFGR